MAKDLAVHQTTIPGLYEIDLAVIQDSRGWFKENYQKSKLEKLGLPKFDVVQNNFSFNKDIGVTRGLHAEPWEKFISVATGRVFGAWVDLRKGYNFGRVLTIEITPEKAVFVPRGVANGYQTLEKNVAYTYLVNAHWSKDAKYTFVNLFDERLNIVWPIAKGVAIVSGKDASHPPLKYVEPMNV